MKVNGLQALVVLVVLTFTCHCARAQPASSNPPLPDRELIVATREVAPFAMKRYDGTWHGISIDLWRRIADQLHLRYRFSEQTTNQDIIDGIAHGSFDIGIAAISVTAARNRVVDFTQPYFTAGLGVAVATGEPRWLAIYRTLFSFGFFQAVSVLLGLAMGVGFVIWLLERRRSEHFSGGAKGLGTGFWWSASTMTQSGGGEHAPTTLPGRLVAIGWMIASIITVAVFTAAVTSTLTQRELQGAVHSVNDLRHVRVGTLAGSAAVSYLDRERIPHRTFPSTHAGLTALQTAALDAFVYDKPLLTWMVLQDFSAKLRVLDIVLEHEHYAIALPKSSGALPQVLNATLLDETESDWWDRTLFQYLGKQQSD
ncbi:MAG: transporter substrate-binding domain-containing protein [Xanthobacteraceae bacterium]